MEFPEASSKTPGGLFDDTSANTTEESVEETASDSGGSSGGGSSRGGNATVNISNAARHEFNAEDRTNAHRLVATAMIVTFIVVAVSQDWWKHLRDFVGTKTHGPATKANPGG